MFSTVAPVKSQIVLSYERRARDPPWEEALLEFEAMGLAKRSLESYNMYTGALIFLHV